MGRDVDLLKIDSFSRDQVMNDANYLQDAWPGLDQTEKRKIVECITNKNHDCQERGGD